MTNELLKIMKRKRLRLRLRLRRIQRVPSPPAICYA
jgi:hypothetical protein